MKGRGRVAIVLVAVAVLALVACGETRPIYITLVDGGKAGLLEVTAEYLTVRDLLEVVEIELDENDRVDPDLYVEVIDGMSVTVTRVDEGFETQHEILPFAHQTMKSEAVTEGEQRLLQSGANGQVETTYKFVLEDGVEVAREQVRREVVTEPIDEIVLLGVRGELTSQPISGTIVYLSGGNAWLIRESSDLRRNITGSGDLDGRVFDLSADGSRLLFTRGTVGDGDTPLNSLWVARTSLVGEEPAYLDVDGVVWAALSPDGSRVAYSTADRTAGVPGWKANNDLWLMTLALEGGGQDAVTEQVLLSTAEIPYAWWGRSFAWAPDGRSLAYAQADEIGLVDLELKQTIPLATLPPYRTQSQWAWVPAISWAPDGRFLAFVAHEGNMDGLAPEDSPVFGLWVTDTSGQVQVRLAEEVGMWAGPRWSPSGDSLVYGQAQSPRNSQDSRYDLFMIDRDGSNTRRLFPPEGWMGLVAPELSWDSDGTGFLLEYEGNVYGLEVDSESLAQLTSDGQSSSPRWAR